MKPGTWIGVVGEHPQNDSEAVIALLKKIFPKANFKILLKSLTGTQLYTPKAKRLLATEVQGNRPAFIIFVYDADAHPSEKEKIEKKESIFKDHKQFKQDILLLNIQELEALILADLEPFNKKFGTKAIYKGNPMHQPKPKEWLRAQTGNSRNRYQESDAIALLSAANIENLKMVPYFKEFLDKLDKQIN